MLLLFIAYFGGVLTLLSPCILPVLPFVFAIQLGRIAALIPCALFGLTLPFSSLAERISRPLVRLGNRLSQNSTAGASVLNSFLLGIGTGLLWAPCAGPILGLILTGAALQGASSHTAVSLLCYAAGAATSLAIALLASGRAIADRLCQPICQQSGFSDRTFHIEFLTPDAHAYSFTFG